MHGSKVFPEPARPTSSSNGCKATLAGPVGELGFMNFEFWDLFAGVGEVWEAARRLRVAGVGGHSGAVPRHPQ